MLCVFIIDFEGFIVFMRNVFDVEGEKVFGFLIEMCLGDLIVIVSDIEVWGFVGVFLYVYVENVDEIYEWVIVVGVIFIELFFDMFYEDCCVIV